MSHPAPFHLRWPYPQMFVVQHRRILFQPVAKNACSSLKTLMVDLSDLPESEKETIRRNVHKATDRGSTGLQVKDYGEEEIRAIFADRGYFRFAVVREPFDRLVSAYLEKFVTNRRGKVQHVATGPVIAAVRGLEAPSQKDHARGITFREFVEHVTDQPFHRLDPHWRPQSDYFRVIPFDHLYGVEDLDMLQHDLSLHCGEPISVPHRNRSRETKLERVAGVADMMPAQLEARAKGLSSESFAEPDLVERVARHFGSDATLFRAATAAQEARRRALRAEAALGGAVAADRAEAARVTLPGPRMRRLRKALSLNGLRRAAGLPPVPRR